MHVALIMDEERLAQEQSMLNRLCIGLMAEGVRVTRIVPDQSLTDRASSAEDRVALARRLAAPMRVLPWMRNARSARLAEQLEHGIPDVLYAVGERAWPLGIDLGGIIERPVMIDVWSARQAARVPLPGPDSPIAGYVAGVGAIARALGRHIDPALVSLVPMGVAVPTQPREILNDPDQLPSMAVIGSSMDGRAYESMLDGLSRVVKQGANIQVFLELCGAHEHDIWRRAERHDLLHCVSAIGKSSLYRSLITRCDVLLMPEHFGDLRSITLEAMAQGLVVIASEDSALDLFIHDRTALIVRRGAGAEWEERVAGALARPQQARQIGLNARQLIESHHRSSEQVSRLIQTLERATTGGTLRLAGKSS